MSDVSEIKNREYRTPEIGEVLGESLHKITASYIKRFGLEPSIQEAAGHGSRRLWSYEDVVKFCVIGLLKGFGFGVGEIRTILDKVSHDHFCENYIWVFHGSPEDFDPFFADYSKYPPGVPSIMEASLSEFDWDRSPCKLFIGMEAVHKQIQDRVRKVLG